MNYNDNENSAISKTENIASNVESNAESLREQQAEQRRIKKLNDLKSKEERKLNAIKDKENVKRLREQKRNDRRVLKEEKQWGYSIEYFMTAYHRRHPNDILHIVVSFQ